MAQSTAYHLMLYIYTYISTHTQFIARSATAAYGHVCATHSFEAIQGPAAAGSKCKPDPDMSDLFPLLQSGGELWARYAEAMDCH